jgi:hypothetical protein
MNQNTRKTILSINPWWLRLLVLCVIGFPVIAGLPIKTNDVMHNMQVWMGYSILIWIFIWYNTGFQQLVSLLSIAFGTALFVFMLGSASRHLIGYFSKDSSKETEYISTTMIMQLITMITVIPYALFAINCFSASKFVARLSYNNSSKSKYLIHAALALRVCQHVGEVYATLLFAWKEENPKQLSPRISQDMNESILKRMGWIKWFFESVLLWVNALFLHTLEGLPYLTHEMRAVSKFQEH